MQNGGCALWKEAPPMGRGAVSIGVAAMQPESMSACANTRIVARRALCCESFGSGINRGSGECIRIGLGGSRLRRR